VDDSNVNKDSINMFKHVFFLLYRGVPVLNFVWSTFFPVSRLATL